MLDSDQLIGMAPPLVCGIVLSQDVCSRLLSLRGLLAGGKLSGIVDLPAASSGSDDVPCLILGEITRYSPDQVDAIKGALTHATTLHTPFFLSGLRYVYADGKIMFCYAANDQYADLLESIRKGLWSHCAFKIESNPYVTVATLKGRVALPDGILGRIPIKMNDLGLHVTEIVIGETRGSDPSLITAWHRMSLSGGRARVHHHG